MRVLTTLTYYHPHWTGLTTYAKRIAEGLVERGHEVTVLTAQHHPSLPRSELIGDVHVVRVPVIGRISRTMVMPSFAHRFTQLVAAHDVVHLHSPMAEAAVVAFLARRASTPVAITHQGDTVMPAGVGNRVVQAAMTCATDYALRRASAISTHNADYASRSRLLAPVAARVEPIEPPNDIPTPNPSGVAAMRAELGIGDRSVIGIAGRWVHEKGFDRLIAAMPSITAEVPGAVLCFAGEQDVAYERTFEREAAVLGGIDFRSVGLLRDRQRLADFYSMCDVFVLPSRTDCFGAVQVESLLCGTRVVAADIPGARSVVRTTGMGRLVDAGSPEQLALAIIDELRGAHDQPSRAEVLTHYDPDASLDRYEAWLRTAIEPRRSPSRPTLAADRPSGLPAEDRRLLHSMLANETDMAHRRRVPRLMELLDVHDGHVVVDGGCGMGFLSAILARLRDVDLIAMDLDGERLAWARREDVPARLVRASVTCMPLTDASVDRVLLSEVLEHLPDDGAALAEVRRVLRPGRLVAISVPHANYPFSWDPINRTLETFGAAPMRSAGPLTGQWSQHERLYLPAELAEVLETAGLEVLAMEELTHHAFPGNHLLVYSLGKPLIEHGLLPDRWKRAADRFRGIDATAGPWNPIRVASRVLHAVDRRNDHHDDTAPVAATRSVSLIALARRPD